MIRNVSLVNGQTDRLALPYGEGVRKSGGRNSPNHFTFVSIASMFLNLLSCDYTTILSVKMCYVLELVM
jgi:hypothetical protein